MRVTLYLTFCLGLAAGTSLADEQPILPFTGLYESRGGLAREKIGADQWRDIPQDVQLLIARDNDITELQLRIQVPALGGADHPKTYTITNTMWLVTKPLPHGGPESGRVEFDVYKRDRRSNQFEDVGDGYCGPAECRFRYFTAEADRVQRYHSHITWQPQRLEAGFNQAGGLSFRTHSQGEWITYKTWANTFTPVRRAPRDAQGALPAD